MQEQNKHLELGVINTLLVDRETPHGLFLVSEDEKDVLLPQAYVTKEMQIGSLIDVFLYTDSEDRLIATTLQPKAKLDEFGFFEVVDVAKFGAFVDWGLPKDLLVPNKLQKNPFKIGEKRFLKVVYDERTHRLVGSEKTQDFFTQKPKGLKAHQEVKIVIISKTPLGFKCIVEDKYEGLIYKNEVFEKIEIGQEKQAYIKTIRKDGNLDISLQATGSKKKSSDADKVLELLKQNKGMMPYNYKSDADLIVDVFSMSKKAYKRTLTKLQEDNLIDVKDTGIYIKG
ncbi:DNA-binding protein [Sulfurimonas lithotrophica]|uniref:DNA-binding protein n=1 Tax=Sulfurimonas lithotrophica TaxID=2590022 RepID=A0A5P8P3H5_9BACT|nr:S1-like domain-containing RNA-binding protein [Sulfurimonas lithotrophica]QFR50090.1 DNA-binding protein [Sulfurimonas lithotrophica]